MKEYLSDRINNLAVSQTLAMAAKARELKNDGKDVIGLSLGEPDFNTPNYIKQAAVNAINEDYNSYTPVDGYVDLKNAIITKFKRDNKLNYDLSQIVVSTGAKQSLSNVAAALINPNDEVILPCPYWVSYSDIVGLNEGVPVEVKTDISNDFKMTAKDLENAITPKTKMLWFSSPCNPSGSVYSKKELRELADVLVKYPNIYVLSDEIYEHINFCGGHFSIAEFEDMYDRTITVNGVSKAYSMTGWRIGYCGAPEEIIKPMRTIQSQSTTNPTSISQWASVEALEGDQSFLKDWIKEFQQRRDMVVQLLNKAKGIECGMPEGAFYVYPSINGCIGKQTPDGKMIENDEDFATQLLESEGVAVVHGAAFGTSPCFRISYATSIELLEEACIRISRFCAGLS